VHDDESTFGHVAGLDAREDHVRVLAYGIPPAAGRARRRSGRVQVKIPVTLMPSAGGGWLDGETVTVSKFGARVMLRPSACKLAHGDTVGITIHRARQSRTGRVVWLDPDGGPQCGIEIPDPECFWGIYFPGGDDDPGSGGDARARTADGSAGVSHAGNGSCERAALVSGISAVYSCFSEATGLTSDGPDELVGMFATPLKPGLRLRIRAESRLFYGRVLAVGGRRPGGKSRVRLQVVPGSGQGKAN
jgi:hypothetical protein